MRDAVAEDELFARVRFHAMDDARSAELGDRPVEGRKVRAPDLGKCGAYFG